MRGLISGLALAVLAGVAVAAEQPVYAPAAAWIKPLELPKDSGPDTATPTRILILDAQNRFGVDGEEYYSEDAVKIQTPQGLSAMGNLVFNWRPDIETLTIHKVQIIRGGGSIDLLGGGHTFTVLRRENNLEMAMLDGALTAALQPEGLQVGDILDMAVTISRNDPVLRGHSEVLTNNLLSQPIDYLRVRQVWPKSKVIRWRQAEGLAGAKTETTAEGTERLIEMTATKPQQGPKGAPARYFELGEIEGTEFQSWAEVSALMAPLYQHATILAPQSALKAEAAKIKADSTDPKTETMAALKLVENEIRYFYLGMNNGGYVPADADQTWSRRFGDCKGKTAVLIALLHELGVEADPALASYGHGDSLDERLPSLAVFDHVLVRAVIEGKVYWLDGTRSDDRNLDDLPVPALHWLLPVRESGATLVRLMVPPADKPLVESNLDLDASGGIDQPAPAHATSIFRSDPGIALKHQLANPPGGDLDKTLRQYWRGQYDWIDIKTVSAVYDEPTGEERISMDGSAKINWKDYADGFGRRLEVRGGVLGWKADYHREAGPNPDAPYAVAYPFFNRFVENIRLPGQGAGFTTRGPDVNKTVAGMNFRRTAKIENGVYRLEASTNAIAAEFPAAEAPAAQQILRDMSDVGVNVYAPSPGSKIVVTINVPKKAAELLARGRSRQDDDDLKGAIEDFDQAIAAKKNWPEALAARGVAHLMRNEIQQAGEDIGRANRIAPDNMSSRMANARLQAFRGEGLQALQTLNSLIAASPGEPTLYETRGEIYMRLNEGAAAVADFGEALRISPQRIENYGRRAEALLLSQNPTSALVEADKFLAARPDSATPHQTRGRVLLHLGKQAEAIQEFDASIQIRPTAEAYLSRAYADRNSDRGKALSDVAAAMRLEPSFSAETGAFVADVYLAAGDSDNAIQILDKVLQIEPQNIALLEKRLSALEDNHQYDAAARDINLLIAQHPGASKWLVRRCQDRAFATAAQDADIANCQAALTIEPDNAEALDACGLLLIRLNRIPDALADFETVLKQRPSSATAHFGRGLARLRNQQTKEGMDDLAVARAGNPNIDYEFAGVARTAAWYGLSASEYQPVDPPNASALVAHALQLINAENYHEAVEQLDRAIQLDPKSALAFATRGTAYLGSQRIDLAAQDFDRALALNSQEISAIEGRGFIARRRGDHTAAIEAFSAALQIDQGDLKARRMRADAFAGNRQYDLALQDADVLLAAAPSNPTLLNNRCWYRAVGGQDLAAALADCDASLNIHRSANSLDSRGFVYLRLGRLDDAITDFDSALAIGERHASSFFARGIAKLRKGASEEGKADLALAREIDPKIDATFANYGVTP